MNHGNRPEEVDGIAPGSAAADLRATLGAGGAPSWQESSASTPDQALLRWAEEYDRIFCDLGNLGELKTGGVEHELWHDEAKSRFIKITVPGSYGRIPRLVEGRLMMRPGSILEYLDRLALSDLFFGDKQLLLGVVLDEGSLRILTEQPIVVGERPSLGEISGFMKQAGFTQAGAEPVFYSEQYRTTIFDCHQGNFLRGATGQIFPFDVIPVRAGADLIAAVKALGGH